MWCAGCEQDVPAVAPTEGEEPLVCARCGGRLASTEPEEFPSPVGDASTIDLTDDWFDWEVEEDLRAAEHWRRRFGESPATGRQHSPPSISSNAEVIAPSRRKKRKGWLGWTVLSFSLMTFVCGAVLLGWSYWGGRGELWDIGLPVTLAGQAGLLIALVLHLESLWNSNRETSDTLDELDERLQELRRATTLLTASHSTAAQSFYAHMAEGANPQLLLADLKGQLDLLAVQMDRHRRAG